MNTPGRLGLPADSKILMATGEYTPGDGMRMAVWAFDVLKHVVPQWRLVLVGDGPQRQRVLQFAWNFGTDDLRVHSLIDANPLAVVEQADFVWGTHPRGGTAFLRAAMNLGKPVAAQRTAETEAITGLALTPWGDPVALAAVTRKMIRELVPG